MNHPTHGEGGASTITPADLKEMKAEAEWHRIKKRRLDLLDAISAELDHAYGKHGREPWGRHEFYAILLEEVEELWDAIKADEPQERVLAEMVQVAAMCSRYFETDDRYRGVHPKIPLRAATPQKETK